MRKNYKKKRKKIRTKKKKKPGGGGERDIIKKIQALDSLMQEVT